MRRHFLWILVSGILAMLPRVSHSQCLQDGATTAQAFVKNFYDWYTTKAGKEKSFASVLAEKKACLAPSLSSLMERERAVSSLCPDEVFLDFDPVIASNGFGPREVTVKVGPPVNANAAAKVPVTLGYPAPSKAQTVVVELMKDTAWKIADFGIQDGNNYQLSAVLKNLDPGSINRCMEQNKANAKKLQEIMKN
jgi:hypothetical protein